MRKASAINRKLHYKRREAITQCYCKSRACTVNKDKWDTHKFMKRALIQTYCSMPKCTCWAEAVSNSEKNQAPMYSLNCYQVTLV